ncbi:pseudouridine-5'-phosphatase-like [Rhodnius prolixus]
MANFRKVTHVLFDLDGLILDSERVYKKIFGSVIESFGKKYIDEVRLSVLGTKEADVPKILVDRLQLPISPEEFSRLAKIEYEKQLADIEVKPGAERLIKHLSNNNVPIALATSSNEKSYKIKTSKHLPLFNHFFHVTKGDEVAHSKPAPDIFLLSAKRFANNPPKPEDCLVFEDAPNGVKAALAAGMQVVMVPEDFLPRELTTDATLVLGSLLDFKPELFGLPPFLEQ